MVVGAKPPIFLFFFLIYFIGRKIGICYAFPKSGKIFGPPPVHVSLSPN